MSQQKVCVLQLRPDIFIVLDRFEDQRDQNTRLNAKVKELDERVRQDEINEAFHKGKTEAYLELQQQTQEVHLII